MTSLSGLKSVCAAVLVISAGWIGVARAAPPTVQPSPGYDRALAESRKAQVEAPVISVAPPPPPPVRPTQRRKVRRP